MIRIENANFANCLVSYLTYINGRSRVSNAICFHLVSLDLSRTDASPGALYCLLYCSFQVELFYGLQNMAIGSRPAEQMQSRWGSHSKMWLRRVLTASTTRRLRVEWWWCRRRCDRRRRRRRRRHHRGEINSRNGHRRLPPSSIPFRARARCPQFQSANARRLSVERVFAFIAETTRPRQGKTNLQIGPLGYA